jgi:hypothetical protein
MVTFGLYKKNKKKGKKRLVITEEASEYGRILLSLLLWKSHRRLHWITFNVR